MHAAVYLPFVLTAVVVGLSRHASFRLRPRAAAWTISLAMGAMALSTVGALGLLGLPLVARLPQVARLGRWHASAVAAHSPVPAWLSVLAVGSLLALAWRVLFELRSLRRQLGSVARTHTQLAECGGGDLVVVVDEMPLAHAVSRTVTRRGRVVVSTAMLDLLDHEERAAVVAHERAHLRHAHSIFLTVGDLATALNPLLGSAAGDLRFTLERWADEDAAGVTTRAVTASALAKAALASLHTARTRPWVPAPALPLHRHGVADRVAALLDAGPRRRGPLAWALLGATILAGLALSHAMHDTEHFFETVRRM